jgi:transposase, IS5 family
MSCGSHSAEAFSRGIELGALPRLSDPGAEEALYDIQSMRAFCGLELGRDAIPDETTILNFRHLLERHKLTKAIFAAVAEPLAAKGELLCGGTIVMPEACFQHDATDARSGLVHTAGVTTGKVHDAMVMANLIREDDTAVYGDKGYASYEKRQAAEAAGVLWAVKEKANRGGRSRSASAHAIAASRR